MHRYCFDDPILLKKMGSHEVINTLIDGSLFNSFLKNNSNLSSIFEFGSASTLSKTIRESLVFFPMSDSIR